MQTTLNDISCCNHEKDTHNIVNYSLNLIDKVEEGEEEGYDYLFY